MTEELAGLGLAGIRRILDQTFPGATIKVGTRVGGHLIETSFWRYHLGISLTVAKIAHDDVPGEAQVIFSERPLSSQDSISRTHLVRKGNLTTSKQLEEFLTWVRNYLQGVIAAISLAFDRPFDPPASDIFDPRLSTIPKP